MSNSKLSPILEIGSGYNGVTISHKISVEEKCTASGEGPCGELYLLTLQGEEGISSYIKQCDCCRQISKG